MTVEVKWCIEGVLLRQHFSGTVTVEELKQSNREIEELTRPYPPNAAINLLIDQSDTTLKLPELHNIVRVSQSFEDMPLGWVALIPSSQNVTGKIGTLAMNFISQIADFHLQIFNTDDAAMDYLADRDDRVARSRPLPYA